MSGLNCVFDNSQHSGVHWDSPLFLTGAAAVSINLSSLNRSTPEPSPQVPSDTLKDMVWIPGGTFRIGSDDHYPEERPAHPVSASGFCIERTPVTNAAFRRFVNATGYVTVAGRVPDAALYPGAQPELLVAGS